MTLRASDEYSYCCENGGKGKLASLYADFGDIPKLPFPMWYMKHGRKIFGETKPFKKVQSVETNRELEELGYTTTWGIFSASEVGVANRRKVP